MTMALKVTIKESGPVPRHLTKAHSKASKVAWNETGKSFHQHLRDKRFTEKHAREARYQKRTQKYTDYKQRKHGHTRPLEWSGETRRAVRTAKVVTAGGTFAESDEGGLNVGGARVTYAGARKLNFRSSPNAPNMAAEFRKLTADEKRQLAAAYDVSLNRELNADNTTSTRTL